MSLFSRGYEKGKEVAVQMAEDKEKRQRIWRYFIKEDRGEGELQFLMELPTNFYEHSVQTFRNGKSFFEGVTCSCDADCELCAGGDKPTFKGAYLVVDKREFEVKDKNGKTETRKDQLKLFVYGVKVTGQLDRISTKYGLDNRIVTMIRLGLEKQTSYTVERGDKCAKLSKKEIENLLPENRRGMYDGTTDSLYKIVEKELSLALPSKDSVKEEDDVPDNRDSIVRIQDDKPKQEVKKSTFGTFKKPEQEKPARSKFGKFKKE